jgi:hypothetical protein
MAKNNSRFNNSIRKDNNIISFPNGFPILEVNGDYHIIHAYDKSITNTQIMNDKLNQLNIWINTTFPTITNNDEINLFDGSDNINNAFRIWNTNKNDFISIVNWLNDPTYN